MSSTHPVRKGQRYKRLLLGLVAFGVVALFVGIGIVQNFAGLVVYAAALGATGLTLYGQFSESITFSDERERRLNERASNAVVSLFSYVGLPTVVVLYLLDATGRYVVGPTVWGAIYAFSAFYLLWNAVYVAFRVRS
ncbi:DUF2178 domain-containing protein [Halorientalis marina]|uniref:DUF2178 domain-containing protein n=1 Tax=Halorientalis marina TaxID=2931976 RepID=UPI001FF1C540|nr:DUF2178 domain-containing protein [Halorientalis marina]